MKKRRVIFNIGLKLVLSISLIFAASFAAMIYFATTLFKNDMGAFIENNNHKISLAAAQSVEIYVRNIIEKSYLAADTLSSSGGYGQKSGSLESYFFSDTNDIFYLALLERKADNSITLKKEIISTEFFSSNGIDEAKLPEYREGSAEYLDSAFKLHITLFNPSVYMGYPVTALSIPYQIQNEGEARSVLLVFIKTDTLRKIVERTDITTSYVVTEDGQILAHPDIDTIVQGADIRRLKLYEDFHQNSLDNGQRRYDDGGVRKIGSYQRINFAGFSLGVVTTVDEKRAFSAVERVQFRNSLLAAIIVIALTLFILYYSKSITIPVKRLVRGAQLIEKGDYGAKVKPLFNDEIALLTDSFNSMSDGLAERERIKDAFGKFVNPEIAERVAKEELTLGGELKEAAVFFSDIRSFTAISEKLQPHQVVEFLNEYMSLMVECINNTHGVVDKFIGDAIMALWGTPISKGNDTENAVNAALMMREALIEFNKGRGSVEKPIIRIGCGINTGPLVAGQIGSENRMEYTVIGDSVNLASRIEALNKPFQTDILISQGSYELVKDIFICEPMKKITVKGKAKPQQIYAVINRRDAARGPKTLEEMRALLGLENIDTAGVDVDGSEEKFSVIE